MIPLIAALLSAGLVSRRERRHAVVALPLLASLLYLALPLDGRAALVAIVSGSASTSLAYALAWGTRRHVAAVVAGSCAAGLVVALAPMSRVDWLVASWGPLGASVVVGAWLVATRPIERTITSAVLAGLLACDASALMFVSRSAALAPELAALEAGLVALVQIVYLLRAVSP